MHHSLQSLDWLMMIDLFKCFTGRRYILFLYMLIHILVNFHSWATAYIVCILVECNMWTLLWLIFFLAHIGWDPEFLPTTSRYIMLWAGRNNNYFLLLSGFPASIPMLFQRVPSPLEHFFGGIWAVGRGKINERYLLPHSTSRIPPLKEKVSVDRRSSSISGRHSLHLFHWIHHILYYFLKTYYFCSSLEKTNVFSAIYVCCKTLVIIALLQSWCLAKLC